MTELMTALCAQFGTGAPPETRPYDPLLERVTAGSCWQFRLTANPTPVSYTHLDVYKRQVQRRPSSPGKAVLAGVSGSVL